MELLTAYRERTRGRPDSEHGQALLRLVLVTLMLAHTAAVADATDPARAVRLWAIALTSELCCIAIFARVLLRPAPSPLRRVLGAVHDNVGITLWLLTAGPLGALALFVYPFVTVGNGFRYGVRYLAVSGTLGGIGIATLVLFAPAWVAYDTIGAGVFLSHVVVTVYTGVLLRRLRQTQDQLEVMASVDALTGLPNRRAFMHRLQRLVDSTVDRELACLYLDLDGFKAVNDRCGHRVGDELLHEVAARLRGCVGPGDVVARLGGDEFSVLLDRPASHADATRVADRIIRAVEEIRLVDGSAVDVSVSIGISFVHVAGRDPALESQELLKAADEMMYAAKRSGRGRYRLTELPGGWATAPRLPLAVAG